MLTVGLRETIHGALNLIVKPQKLLPEVDASDHDALAIPGGFEPAGFYEDAYDENVLRLIQAFDAGEQPIASIGVRPNPSLKDGRKTR